MTEISAIIVAAGQGERFQSDLPKQYNMLGNQSILTHTINGLISHPKVDELIVVIHKNHKADFQRVISNISDPKLQPVVIGAKTRGESVFSGLKAARWERVLIHDAARPLLPHAALDRLIGALETKPAAFLALPIVDALWRDTDALTPVSRSDVWRAQTPQAFLRQDLISAYETAGFNLSDDVEVALSAGIEATPILGDEENFKITYPEDLHRAKRVLEARMTPRIGIGYDVHAFENGNAVTLNGIEIAHDKALKGHSDADVAMHAITDAIYGALADGDIGQHFPPTDPSWKDQASDLFLRHACQRCHEAGYKIANLDCTIICEQPKIGPHALSMRENLAQICAIKLSQVSVKATTSEQLGFTGREEGIAAQAIAQLVPA